MIILNLSIKSWAIELRPNQRLFSIGDLHGDLDAFKNALIAARLYSVQTNQWVGRDANLVILGDVVDQGPQTRELLDFIIKLEDQAKKAGGEVHTLLGNHELLITLGELDFSHSNDSMSFNEFKNELARTGSKAYISAFRGQNKYAQWNLTKKTILTINQTTFVHAGLANWVLNYTSKQINNLVRSWMAYYQGVGDMPAPETEWVMQTDGPLWTRSLVKKTNADEVDIDAILKHFNSDRIVIGHSTVHSLDQALNHPVYGNKVIMNDTQITRGAKQLISIFEYNHDGSVTALEVSNQDAQVLDQIKTKSVEKIKKESTSGVLSCRRLFE